MEATATYFANLPLTARVWIYQADRPFSMDEAAQVTILLDKFAKQWQSHSQDLIAEAALVHQRFVVLAVDEGFNAPGGCSIDTSVRFIKDLGAHFQRDFFNRMLFSYMDGQGEVHTVDNTTFAAQYQSGIIDAETPVFDTLANTLEQFRHRFPLPLAQSWHARFV